MASGAKIYSGTYIPTEDSSTATINTGATGWTHFLIAPHTLPHATPHARCLGLKYVDFGRRWYQSFYGSSADDSTTPGTGRVNTDNSNPSLDQTVSVNGSTITFSRLIASQGGLFKANTQYDWYAW